MLFGKGSSYKVDIAYTQCHDLCTRDIIVANGAMALASCMGNKMMSLR